MDLKQQVSLLIAILAVLVYSREHLPLILSIGGYGSAVVFGLLVGAGIGLFTGKKYTSTFHDDPVCGKVLKELLVVKQSRQKQQQQLTCLGQKRQLMTFGRNVEAAIDDFIHLTMRDFVLCWLKPLVSDSDAIAEELRDDIWQSLVNLKERMSKIDELKLLTHDVPEYLCRHYQRIRQASNSMNSKDKKPVILLRPYLTSSERELDFLRKVAELLVVHLAPKSYSQSQPLKHLIRELIAGSVLCPAINQLCDPDFINLKLTGYLQRHRETLEQHKQSYTYTATYESFIKMIHGCECVEQLKHVKSNIITEIMQATVINNLKKAKGIDVEKEFTSQRNAKGDLLQARNLKRYINQLNFAKAACEKRIKLLGEAAESSFESEVFNSCTTDSNYRKDGIVLPYEKLVENDFARCFFLKFLLREDSRFLLEFYVAVEELKDCLMTKRHQLGSEIYDTYIPQISNSLKLDRSILKGMEKFLLGETGPDAFVQAQELVYKFVEERYYPSFIVSDLYQQMLTDAKRVGVEFEKIADCPEVVEVCNGESEEPMAMNGSQASNLPLSDHSNFAKTKLDQLNERLSNKTHALRALQNSAMVETKSQVMGTLEKEIEEMKGEKSALDLHIKNSDLWIDNIGRWSVDVHSVEMVEEKDKTVPYFLLVVRLDDEEDDDCELNDGGDDEEEDESGTVSKNDGWVVKRKLGDFVELSQRLAQIGSWVKAVELPKDSKIKSKGNDKGNLDAAIATLNSFLQAVLQDDELNRSELLYLFLSPSPDHLKYGAPNPKKSKFFFANLFKSNHSSSQEEASDDDELLFFDDIDSSLKDDRIAEPLYSLIGEIFDMRGVSMLLRRTLITFVQITFGSTINRQIRDTVSWLVSEPMIVYYVYLLKESIWSGGRLKAEAEPRTDEQKLETRVQALQQLLMSIPEVFNNLFGQQQTKKSIRKIFESLQDVQLNKQLFYELFELLIIEIFPELKSSERQQ